MAEFLDIILDTIVCLLALLLISRILGRKTFSQLTFYDFVIGITIGNVGAAMITDASMLYTGLLSLGVATLWALTVNKLTLISLPVRKLIDSEPLIVIYNGMILEKHLKEKNYNVNDLLELLREQGIFDPGEVEIGIIESDGELSIQKKQEFREVTLQDLNLQSTPGKRKIVLMTGKELIINGKIIVENVNGYGFTVEEIQSELKFQGIRLEDVTVALLTPKGELYLDAKSDGIFTAEK